MRVLIACEFSGIVRDAFLARGHDAMSCDLLPTEKPGPHYQGDVFDIINDGWDMMIAHPPCTYLANSGVQYLHKRNERWDQLKAGREFFLKLWKAPIKSVAIENPIPHKYADLPRYCQKVQPHWFGDKMTKATCLWLRGLPPLFATACMADTGERYIGRNGRSNGSSWYQLATGRKGHERSRTFPGIAAAMASQWG